MYKKLFAILLALMLVFASTPVLAADMSPACQSQGPGQSTVAARPVTFQDTITVTKDGGKYDIGFVTLTFPKNFIDSDRLPITFNVIVNAENGIAGIELSPDTKDFNKKVAIKVDAYNGLLYDDVKGKNVKVDVKNQVIFAEHFSRYSFR